MNSNLKYILEMLEQEDRPTLSKEEKAQFVDSLKRFSEMGDSIYGKGNLQEMSDRVRDIVEKAEMIVSENGDWFDQVSMKRHLKTIAESYKTFESTAKEISQLQERLSMAYEDIGQQLNKYFDVN